MIIIWQILYFFVLSTAGNVTSGTSDDEITQKDQVGWVIALISGFSALGGLVFTGMTFRQNIKSNYVVAISSFDAEIAKIEQSQTRLARPGSPVRLAWEINFLNAIGRIAHLVKTGRADADLATYFRLEFQWALSLIQNVPTRAENFAEIVEICRNRSWEPKNMG